MHIEDGEQISSNFMKEGDQKVCFKSERVTNYKCRFIVSDCGASCASGTYRGVEIVSWNTDQTNNSVECAYHLTSSKAKIK